MEARDGEDGVDTVSVIAKNSGDMRKESREEMLARHRKEIADLQNKEIGLKKAAAKGSKAEQKAKKKKVEEDVSNLMAELTATHSSELASLGYNKEGAAGKANLDNLVMAIAGVTVANSTDPTKANKGAKRRERRANQEAQREQRIHEEQSNVVSLRMAEYEKLHQKLAPLGLAVREIKPDGHCLYRAVEDQLSRLRAQQHSFQELRKMAASYMREHAAEFLPFFLNDGKVEADSGDLSPEFFHRYCEQVEATAAWGGQLELGALTHCLKRHIIIFSGSFPDVEMGKEYKIGNGTNFSNSNSSIMLSYHVHAYGLGEHYNSVVPRLC